MIKCICLNIKQLNPDVNRAETSNGQTQDKNVNALCKFYGTYRSEALGRSRLSIATGPGRPHYQLTASESWTRGSRPLTVLYLPGSPPLCHGPLSFGSDNEATDHPPAPTSGFGSSLIRQPLCSLLPGVLCQSNNMPNHQDQIIKSKSWLSLLTELEFTRCNEFLIICHHLLTLFASSHIRTPLVPFLSSNYSTFHCRSFWPLTFSFLHLLAWRVEPAQRIVKAELVDYPQDEGPIRRETSQQSKICSLQ